MSRKKGDAGNKPQEKAKLNGEAGLPQGRQYSQAGDSAADVAVPSQSQWKRMNRLHLTLLKAIVVPFLLTCVCGCTTVESRLEPGNPYAYDPNLGLENEDILAHFNLHRGRWWNYYARGSWLLMSGHYGTALKDFEVALDKRSRDSRDARTYGMHFMDYFPHRESGVAYCLLAGLETNMAEKECLFDKAINELRTSIEQEESSKAKFYLKRATTGFWSTAHADMKPPVVWIENNGIDRWADVPTLYINGYAATLKIRASDDQSGVGTVWVDSKRLFVESAEEDFNEPTVLTVDSRDKAKTVVFNAMDLAGNKSQPVTVKLIVDTAPPTAAIKVHEDKATLLGWRIPVDVIAVDDQGLKSVRVGEDPYDNRDCRGQLTWEGRFFAEPGVRDLAVEIADRAGNVTAMSVTLEPERTVAGIARGEHLFAHNASLGLGQNPWRVPFDAGPRVSDNTLSHPVQFSTLRIHSLPSLLGYEGAQGAASSEYRRHQLVLSELERRNTLVSTSHPRYLLQGQVKNAAGLERITIKVDNEELEHEKVLRQGDHVIFSAWVPLPDCNEPRSIAVEAHFVGEDSLVSEPNLRVERVPNRIWDSRSVYSVILLPLEDEYCLYRHCSKKDEANTWVLEAVQDYNEFNVDDGQLHQRFDCKALSGWNATQVMQKLDVYYRNTRTRKLMKPSEPEKRTDPGLLAKTATDLANAYETDLAIYGLVKDEGDMFEVKIGFTGAESKGKPLLSDKWIDIYGVDRDSEYYIEGLSSKLKTKMPRVRGKIERIVEPRSRTIEVNRGEKDYVFENMDLLLYDVSGSQKNPTFAKMCEARAKFVREKRLDAEVEASKWATVLKRWKNVRVISK